MHIFTLDPVQSNIRHLLLQRMANNNVTVQDLAERCACSQQTITDWLSMNDGEWTMDNVFMISDALGLSLSFSIPPRHLSDAIP
jgi:hypothetical protein